MALKLLLILIICAIITAFILICPETTSSLLILSAKLDAAKIKEIADKEVPILNKSLKSRAVRN